MRILFILLAIVFPSGYMHLHSPTADFQSSLAKRKRTLISCGVDASTFDPTTNTVPLLPGWGAYRMPVTSKKHDSAYVYFQQGINLYYGFHIIEALASFYKSTGFDSSFAMGYWGVALSYGPNINDDHYTESPKALAAAEKASALSGQLSAPEKALIGAMLTRYTIDTTLSRLQLNQAYADAMGKIYRQFPNNQDIAALYADALMQQHPWDLYDLKGQPKTWTPPIVTTLEAILKINPSHPGACHYYIHAVEASDHPERALAVSDRLPGLMPGVAHVVHMPAHIYIRTGNYNMGWKVDTQAVQQYKNYLARYPAVADNTPLYLIHNLHMQAACAAMEGRYADAMQAAIDTRQSFDSSWMSFPDFMGTYIQYIYMTPLLTQLRFGRWDDILKEKPAPSTYIYADVLTHFCRGIAYARTQHPEDAEKELAALHNDTSNQQLLAPAPNYSNPGINGTRVAERILTGVIAESRGQLPQAITAFEQAVQFEDGMIYDEPKDWQQPARQFLGNILLKATQYAAAERTFREDLQQNPKNGWSYTGLATALKKQGKEKQAALAQSQAQKAFTRSDIKVTAAVL